jgi:VWFA-related protein
MCRLWFKAESIAWIAAVLFLVLLPVGVSAANDAATASVYVNVEQDGKPVSGLGAGNFRVFIDGRGREFTLESAESPACIVLLVEHGARSVVQEVRNTVSRFVESAPYGHWYALVAFDREIQIVQDFTKDKKAITAAFAALPRSQWPDVGTNDALVSTLDIMSRMSGRRVIVFVGSGLDAFSRHTFGDVEDRLESTDVEIFSLGTSLSQGAALSDAPSLLPDLDRLQARTFLTMLAEKSGGKSWSAGVDIALRSAMNRLFEDLSVQYRLVVKGTIPADGRFHKVRVDAFTVEGDERTDFKVRARQGFRRVP